MVKHGYRMVHWLVMLTELVVFIIWGVVLADAIVVLMEIWLRMVTIVIPIHIVIIEIVLCRGGSH